MRNSKKNSHKKQTKRLIILRAKAVLVNDCYRNVDLLLLYIYVNNLGICQSDSDSTIDMLIYYYCYVFRSTIWVSVNQAVWEETDKEGHPGQFDFIGVRPVPTTSAEPTSSAASVTEADAPRTTASYSAAAASVDGSRHYYFTHHLFLSLIHI